MYSLYYNHTIYENGTRVTTSECFYDDSIPSPDYRVISPTLNKEVGKAGSLSFTLPPTNIEYSNIDREKSEIVCYKFDKEVWRGRILSDNVDFYKQRKITCEGELTYLNDTCAGTKYWKNSSQGALITYFTFLGQLLDVHNQKNTVPGTDLFAGPYDKRIYRGLWPKVQDDGRASFETKNETVLELVNNIAKEVDMYPKITWDDRGQGFKRYLDFVKGSPAGQPNRLGETTTPIIDNETNNPTVVINGNTIVCVTNDLVEYDGREHIYNGNVWTAYYEGEGRYFENTIDQEIVFGENLLDFTRSYDPTQIVTAVVLRGSKKDTQDNTDAYVDLTGVGGWTDNGIVHPANADYIYSANAFQTYGYKEAHLELETTGTELEQVAQLKRLGMNYLRVMQFSTLKLEVSAVDLNHLGVNTDDFDIYYDVKVISDPHGLNKWFPIMSMSIPLDAIENSTYSLGTTEDITLTGVGQRANEEFYNMIKALPTEESVLNAAKSQAAGLIKGATSGYITIRYGQDGKSDAIIISQDPDWEHSSRGMWVWNSGGLGYFPSGWDGTTLPNNAMTSDGSIVADRITTGVMNADRIRGGHLSIATSIDKNAPWTTIEPNYISFRNGPNAGTEIGYIVPQVLASSHAGTQRGLVYNSYLYIFECDELWVGNQEVVSGDNDHKSVCALGAKGDSNCYDQTLGIYKMQVGGKNIYIRRGFIVNEEDDTDNYPNGLFNGTIDGHSVKNGLILADSPNQEEE